MDIIAAPLESREQTILELREFSRKLVRELGFMRNTLADSGLAPSAVHAIIEIGATPGIQARDLAQILRLDKSNASRQIARLETAGFVKRHVSSEDARSADLHLTASGQKLRRKIDKFATDQVSDALRRLVPEDQQALVRSLALYADALARGHDQPHDHKSTRAAHTQNAHVSEGYRPGCIGDIASLHARFYAKHAGFGVYFERKVASELGAFAEALPAKGKALWLVMEGERTLGSLAIDGDLATRVAHLRWFIIGDALRGSGVGRELMSRAMAFVDTHYDETYLWTFKSLDAARHLYESFGFALADEAEGEQWGAKVIEQRFTRRSKAR